MSEMSEKDLEMKNEILEEDKPKRGRKPSVVDAPDDIPAAVRREMKEEAKDVPVKKGKKKMVECTVTSNARYMRGTYFFSTPEWSGYLTDGVHVVLPEKTVRVLENSTMLEIDPIRGQHLIRQKFSVRRIRELEE